jgi:hypothetical protein
MCVVGVWQSHSYRGREVPAENHGLEAGTESRNDDERRGFILMRTNKYNLPVHK